MIWLAYAIMAAFIAAIFWTMSTKEDKTERKHLMMGFLAILAFIWAIHYILNYWGI